MTTDTFPIDAVRARFPALADGRRIFLDAPGGTQMCAPALAAMVAHVERGMANVGGAFATSRETGELADAAHAAVADLIGAAPDEIAFGPNMTSLTLAVSRALAAGWQAGDELVVTRLDHDANVAPWLLAARDCGMTVRWLDFDPATGLLDLDALPGLLGARTRLVAVGGASNAIGTLNDIPAIATIVRAGSEALLFVDAVQSAPHVPTDVAALGCDLLVFSPYKFFGPHQGVLWGRPAVLERLEAYKVRPAADRPIARRFETGTPAFEAQAATIGMIAYLEWLGGELAPGANGRPARLRAALAGAHAYETGLSDRLLAGLAGIEGVRLWGPPTSAGRVPTFGLTIAGHTPRAIAEALAAAGVHAWAGHFYAVEVVARLGVAERGGLLRLGLCHYTNAEEVDRTVVALAAIVRDGAAIPPI